MFDKEFWRLKREEKEGKRPKHCAIAHNRLWGIAKKAFRASKYKHSFARRRCDFCFAQWRETGAEESKMPPMFPVDYTGRCPSCNGKLSEPVMPV